MDQQQQRRLHGARRHRRRPRQRVAIRRRRHSLARLDSRHEHRHEDAVDQLRRRLPRAHRRRHHRCLRRQPLSQHRHTPFQLHGDGRVSDRDHLLGARRRSGVRGVLGRRCRVLPERQPQRSTPRTKLLNGTKPHASRRQQRSTHGAAEPHRLELSNTSDARRRRLPRRRRAVRLSPAVG